MQFVHTKEAVQEAENEQDPLAALKGIQKTESIFRT